MVKEGQAVLLWLTFLKDVDVAAVGVTWSKRKYLRFFLEEDILFVPGVRHTTQRALQLDPLFIHFTVTTGGGKLSL